MVVGDQSSGKSSLLEGLTGLSFPIASDLCTRFATQIVLRRAPDEESSIKVSIIPGPTANGDEAEKQKLSKFGRSIQGHDLRSEDFASVLDEVPQHQEKFLVVADILGCCLYGSPICQGHQPGESGKAVFRRHSEDRAVRAAASPFKRR